MAIFGVAIGTASLVIVLSVFNGFENLISSLYKSFDPDIKITSAEGEIFKIDSVLIEKINKIDGIKSYSRVLEERVLLRYNKKEHIATLKGVDSRFHETTDFDKTITKGTYFYDSENTHTAIIGQGISYMLSVGIDDYISPIQVFVPQGGLTGPLNPANFFRQKSLYPMGIFSIQADFDAKYIISTIGFAEDLLKYKKEDATALEMKITNKKELFKKKKEVQQVIGKQYVVKSQPELHEALFKMIKTEKIAVFIIFTFILIIATFNMGSALIMLIIDKAKDTKILIQMGATLNQVQKVYFFTGFLTNIVGSLIGTIIGVAICLIQQKYKVLKLGSGDGFVIDYYPVQINTEDVLTVFVIIITIGLIMSFLPTLVLKNKLLKSIN